MRTDGNGKASVVLDTGGAWLDGLAVAKMTGLVAVAAGKTVHLVPKSGGPSHLSLTRTAGAIALSADGTLLATAHGHGVTIHDLNGGPVRECAGAGGHVSVAFSPDGRFIVAGTAEPALAGWRLADGQGFKMANFPGKPLSFAWIDAGDALVTSGGPALLAWPFHGANGPMGEAAGVYRPRLGLCTAVAALGHWAAAGWSDGGVDMVHLGTDIARHVAGPPPPADIQGDPREGLARVSGLAFSPNGKRLAWCREDGAAGVAKV
jgi:WD40-like Beta Propeller Repeat